ncbi:phospholipase A2 [Megalopta genalis]|uniref:phospholipase A2 n=1 Tax=Megalopta genalis TaxID=115081 RepID=UPI003FD62218
MSTYLLLFSVLFILGCGRCDDSVQLRITYISTLEKTAITIIKSGQKIGKVIKHVPILNTISKSVHNSTSTISNVLNPYKDRIKLIFPGTYWCGDGDIADNERDLGRFNETDACCRAHDTCPEGIEAGAENYGLKNNGIFTRSACYCDEVFYNCLKKAASIISADIGTTYFNILRPQCFKLDYPISDCEKYSRRRLIHDKCLQYKLDTDKFPEYQWFDSPDFI